MTAKEVSGMDPMQRQLLEVAYEAFENGELLQKIATKNLPFVSKLWRLTGTNSWYTLRKSYWK